MEYETIKELAQLMDEMELTVLSYASPDESIRLERGAVAAPTIPVAPAAEAQMRQETIKTNAKLFEVKSPTVGTFYNAPEPGKSPYVQVGDTVRKGDILCLIEAMKMLNELTAERDGVIVEICAENQQIVEYGQPLFQINAAI